jgi:two-component system NtrC family sensor kinase
VAVVDEQGRVMRCNQRAAELAGAAAPKALLGHGLARRLDPDHPAVVAALVDDAAARDGSVAAVLARTVRDGEPARATVRVGDARVLDLVVAPHPDGGAVVAFDDVTADRERAAALARADARYTRLVEAASDAIVTVDAAGRITSVNRAFERGMGIDRERVLGIPFVALLRDDGAEMRRVFEDTIRGERVRRELRYADAASAERVASIITAPIVEDGRVQGALAVIRDVTDERRMAEQLLQREKLAAVGQLVSGIAQELRNPLDAVLANAGALLQGDGDAASREASARAAHAEATRAARIVDKLMAFARPHAPERSPTDVNRVLLDALELRRFALRLQQVDIALDLDYDLPATWADPYQLEQVFLDLLTNAEHALARGGAGAAAARRVTLRSRRDGDALAVTVADTGPGLGAEQLARVFQPFFTTKPVGAGAGFGLAIADRLVRAHGGAITVDTAPGRGAAFTVRLPVVAAPATDT